jgi:hypothetical protein
MPRYFFHVHLDGTVEPDVVGLELADLSVAIVCARRVRAQIMSEDTVDQLRLEIADETGRIVAAIA